MLLCLGDPAGIGPELVARAMGDGRVHDGASICVIGDAVTLERAASLVGATASVIRTDDPRSQRSTASLWPVLDLPVSGELPDGSPSVAGGRAAGEAVTRASLLAMRGEADAVAAAPSNKHALHLAGFAFDDHTALLSHLTGTPDAVLMPVSGSLRVVSVTNHLSLAEACRRLDADLILRAITGTAGTLRQMGIERPRIAVAALNPHNGEGGDLGDDEERKIAPAVEAARRQGIDASGPLAADSLFTTHQLARYDVFVTMYHDQGRIAQKALAFGKIVVITAGLPFFFATVGHGTAYDIAWEGKADAANLIETLRAAIAAAASRRRLVATSPTATSA